MANTKSAAKNARQALRKHARRVSAVSELKTLKKKVLALSADKNCNKDELEAMKNMVVSKFAKAGSKGYIKPQTASRKIGRLVKAINRNQATEGQEN
ncbi:MAG: 30S ribosomal protein S20 [Candidatus Riflebacteria bacterium]|nr:30S ribosomal protein S20 [Candidatus Riflebacteria bacterium]